MSFARITPHAETPYSPTDDDDECPEIDVDQVVTTPEELEAFYIVRSILRQFTNCARIQMKDSPTECNVLLDGDRGKPICRFHFHDMTRRAVFFAQGTPQVELIERVNELYDFAPILRATLARYDRDFPPARQLLDKEILA